MKREEYKIVALKDLQTEDGHTWTKGLDYEVAETDTKFQITSDQGQLAYVIRLKDVIMTDFKQI